MPRRRGGKRRAARRGGCARRAHWPRTGRAGREGVPPRRRHRETPPPRTRSSRLGRRPRQAPHRCPERRRATHPSPRARRVRFPALPPRVRVQVEEHPHPRGRRPAERLVKVRPHVVDVRVPRQWAVSTAAAAVRPRRAHRAATESPPLPPHGALEPELPCISRHAPVAVWVPTRPAKFPL